MKSRILLFLLTALLLLSGCGLNDGRYATAPTTTEVQTMKEIIGNTAVIEIRDVVEHRFAEEFSQMLTEEEKKELLQAIDATEEKEQHFGGYLMYALDFLDADGKLLTTLYVDNDITIEGADGNAYLRTGSIAQVLDRIESAYSIRERLYNKKPGSGYFSLLPQADHGYFYEITDNNFIKGMEKDVAKTEISALSAELGAFTVSEEPTRDIDVKYILELYSEDGGLYYKFFLNGEGRVFTIEYYEIQSDGLAAWIQQLLS